MTDALLIALAVVMVAANCWNVALFVAWESPLFPPFPMLVCFVIWMSLVAATNAFGGGVA